MLTSHNLQDRKCQVLSLHRVEKELTDSRDPSCHYAQQTQPWILRQAGLGLQLESILCKRALTNTLDRRWILVFFNVQMA
jgi:hypothetical protein